MLYICQMTDFDSDFRRRHALYQKQEGSAQLTSKTLILVEVFPLVVLPSLGGTRNDPR